MTILIDTKPPYWNHLMENNYLGLSHKLNYKKQKEQKISKCTGLGQKSFKKCPPYTNKQFFFTIQSML